jgi:hypothetical protein
MAITGTTITTALMASQTAGIFPMLGPSYKQIALAVGTAFQLWGVGQPQNLALFGGAAGPVGAGVILPATSKIIVPPDPTSVALGLTSAGVVGPTSSSLATAIAVGFSSAMNASAQYTGPSTVGLGGDVSKIVIANAATLAPIMATTFLSLVGPGPVGQQLAAGLSIGITNLLLLGVGSGVVTPVPGTVLIPPSYPGVTGPSAVV